MTVKSNNILLGRDVMKDICELLNIEYDKEKLTRLTIDIPVDDVVLVAKEFYPTARSENETK